MKSIFLTLQCQISFFPGIKNLHNALRAAGNNTPVTTSLVVDAFPPSNGRFSAGSRDIMRSIVEFLAANRSPLLVNVYSYFAYSLNQQQIQLDYANFTANRVVVTYSNNGLQYRNLFDALTDATYSSIEKVGGWGVDIVITESGWPSAENGNIATIQNASTYINNLFSHVSGMSGTPKRPGKSIETYIFALFNENIKPGAEDERHFGLYYPYMREVYPVTFR
ncbi:hypothetical protein MKW92_006764 [Papaver armeniacum]|nr:hypothetical protein MKW92_006764 [Papaver armeniacum]